MKNSVSVSSDSISNIKNSPFNGHKLSYRLTFTIIAVSSIITLILTIYQIYSLYRSELTHIHHELDHINDIHIKPISQSLWAANKQDLQLQLDGLIQTPYIHYAAIREDKILWTEAGIKLSENYITRQYELSYEFNNNKELIGLLLIHADLQQMYDDLFQEAVHTLLRNGLKTFLVAAFMLWFFHQQVNRYLSTITNHLKGYNIDQKPEELKLNTQNNKICNEFLILISAINQMQKDTFDAHQEIILNNQKFHNIADFTIDWESWFDRQGHLVWVNPSVTRITGYTPEECYKMKNFPLDMLSNSKDKTLLGNALSNALNETTEQNIEFEIQHKKGNRQMMAISWQPIYDSEGAFDGFRSSVRDITYLKKVEFELQNKLSLLKQSEEYQAILLNSSEQEQARIKSLLSAMNIGILFENTLQKVQYINPFFRTIWLLKEDEHFTNVPTSNILANSLDILDNYDVMNLPILKIEPRHSMDMPLEIKLTNGRIILQSFYPVIDQNKKRIGNLWIHEDITDKKQNEKKLIYLAERDSLTSLYNRHRFQEEIKRVLNESERNDFSGALLFFDLDEFKHVNDNFGHHHGDTVLISVANEIRLLLRKNELFFRLGGDEFSVILAGASQQEAVSLSERIIATISKIKFNFNVQQNLSLTTSLGIALYPQHGIIPEELVAHADTAMYQAKDSGKNTWSIYNFKQSTSKQQLIHLNWNEKISHALNNNLFTLFFQGIYQTTDSQLCHLETLLRLQNESEPGKYIMPGQFIPPAEKSGKILEIDRWVLKESVKVLSQYPGLPAIAVNISGRSFDDPDLPEFINQQLLSQQVKPERLMIELTETSAVSDIYDAQQFIDSLRATGCLVCLDDFGSGFSSFTYLKHLNVDILKIDGIFIRDLPVDKNNQIFVKAMVDVARGLGKRTVAEFVENEQTLLLLKEFGVDLAQGYHLDIPQADHPAFHQKSHSLSA